MTAALITLADAVVADMHTVDDWNQLFVPERTWLGRVTLPQLVNLYVAVIPVSFAPSPDTRGGNLNEAKIEVHVLKKLPAGGIVNADVDAMVNLLEAIGVHFLKRRLGNGVCNAVTIEPMLDPEQLEKNRVCLSALTLHFVVR